MESVLIKASAFVLVIILGYVLKRVGFFEANHFGLISKMVLNITLPCAIVSNFSQLTIEVSLLLVVVIGIVCNLFTIGLGYFVALRKAPVDQAFHMINFSGYNIGCFTLPYVQGFLGPIGVVVTCLFDAGNSLLCTGGTYSIASAVVNKGNQTGIKTFFKTLFSSIPLDTYVIMLMLSILNISIPKEITTFTDLVGGANGFLAMLMIGIGFELHLKRSQTVQIVKTLMVRYGVAALFAVVFYLMLPFSQEIRAILALIVFAPISAVAPAFTYKTGGDFALSSTINSLSIIISIFVMTLLIGLMGIA
jgi:hypothetical protein